MTDLSHTDNELVSSFLDGEATAAEADRVTADPALLVRANQLRAASEFVSSPVSVPATELDQLRARAIAGVDTNVIGFKTPGERRHERMRWFGRVATSAAVLLVVGGLGFAIANRGSGNDNIKADHSASETPTAAVSAETGPASAVSGDTAEAHSADINDAPEKPDAPMDADSDPSVPRGQNGPTSAESRTSQQSDDPPKETHDTQPNPTSTNPALSVSQADNSFDPLTTSFDPFGSSLDPVTGLDDLTTVVRRLLIEPPVFDSDHDDESVRCIAALLEESIQQGAAQVDSTYVLVNGQPFIVVASRFDTGTIKARTAPVDNCTSVKSLFIGP